MMEDFLDCELNHPVDFIKLFAITKFTPNDVAAMTQKIVTGDVSKYVREQLINIHFNLLKAWFAMLYNANAELFEANGIDKQRFGCYVLELLSDIRPIIFVKTPKATIDECNEIITNIIDQVYTVFKINKEDVLESSVQVILQTIKMPEKQLKMFVEKYI